MIIGWILGKERFSLDLEFYNINKFSSDGMINKWVFTKNGTKYLIKDSLYKYSKEPYSELICSKISEYLKLNFVPYNLINSPQGIDTNSNKLSICKFEDNIFKLTNLMDVYNITSNNDLEILNNLKRFSIINKNNIESFMEMFLFDALVSNPDRHYGNIHLKDGKFIILDNGQALSSMNNFEDTSNVDRSLPFQPFHDQQINYLEKYFNINRHYMSRFQFNVEDLIDYLEFQLEDIKIEIGPGSFINIIKLIKNNYKNYFNNNKMFKW